MSVKDLTLLLKTLILAPSFALSAELKLDFSTGEFFTYETIRISNNSGEYIHQSSDTGKAIINTVNFTLSDEKINELVINLESLDVFGWKKRYRPRPHFFSVTICEGGWSLELESAKKSVKSMGECAEPEKFQEVKSLILRLKEKA